MPNHEMDWEDVRFEKEEIQNLETIEDGRDFN
jgi:hypothetical protein